MLKNNPYIKAYLNVINESATSTDFKKYQRIAKTIGGVYIPETNTIDCKTKKVEFKDSWLNENGSFDFKLINTNNNWSHMFEKCKSLIRLPENFIIPQNVTNCFCMFNGCKSLVEIPTNFTIPDNVVNCAYMFNGCKSLTCLPENFKISNSVKDCQGMFSYCKSLNQLSNDFRIPNESKYDAIFNGCDKLEDKDPKAYIMVEI